MKFIHTSDWHIGKVVDGFDLLDDQKHFLVQFIDYAKQNKPDAILIAGDIYDRSVPPADAVELLDSVLTELVLVLKIPIIIISGNHDSSERLGFANTLLERQGLYIFSSIEQIGKPVIIEDDHGPVYIYGIPFIHPAQARSHYSDDEIRNYNDVYARVMVETGMETKAGIRNICITHGYIIGTESLEESESERRLNIGGTEQVDVSHFEGFNYTALGHLHGPQRVKRDSIRYAGSPLKYSFSEARQHKSIAVVELDEEGNAAVETVSFEPLKDMRVITGTLEDLTSKDIYSLANTNDYVKAVLTNEGEVFDAIGTLKKVYPNIMRCEYQARKIGQEDGDAISAKDFETASPLELFKSFYEYTEGEALGELQSEVVEAVMDEVKQEVER